MIDDFEIRQLAASQHGVVSWEQLYGAGLKRNARYALVDGRRWEELPGGVVRLVGAPDTQSQRLSREVLAGGPGAALAGSTAAAHWGVRGAVLEPIQTARVRGHVDRAGDGVRHDPLLLPESHVLVLDGIPVVTPARALFDIAGSEVGGAKKLWWIEKMQRLVNNALTDHLVTGQSLHEMLLDLAQRGRPGIRVMRELLKKIPPDYVATASGVETRVAQLCERHGIPPMRRQVNLGDGQGWIGRVDFVDAALPFVLEVQSERFHTSQIDRQLDETRIERLEGAGYIVATVTDTDVWYRPDTVIATIMGGRRRAARLVQSNRA